MVACPIRQVDYQLHSWGSLRCQPTMPAAWNELGSKRPGISMDLATSVVVFPTLRVRPHVLVKWLEAVSSYHYWRLT